MRKHTSTIHKLDIVEIKPVVVIPFYHEDLSKWEELSIRQCLNVLRRHSICLLKPESLTAPSFVTSNRRVQILSLDDKFFQSTRTYNQLLKARFFYDLFSRYSHILIYQLDAFVFYDSLIKWCREDYSYIGSPWIDADFAYKPISRMERLLSRLPLCRLFIKGKFIGNGGFSLRRIPDFLRCFEQLSLKEEATSIHEDEFWGQFISTRFSFFKVPTPKVASLFSIELEPAKAMAKNGGHLPFGCHNWARRDILFWLPYIQRYI